MTERIAWEELNAYVDGELPSDRASAVAEAIAADRELARQAALLSRMKAGLAGALELPEGLRTGLPPASAAGRPGRRALAAALALLLLAGAAGTWLWRDAAAPGIAVEQAAPTWLADALALHRALAAGSEGEVRRVGAPGFPGLLPDLSAAMLTLSAVSPAEVAGMGRGSAVQYRGSRGCRVSLFALEAPRSRLSEELERGGREGFDFFRWRVGAIDYLLLAEGMDAGRLETIAQIVQQATRRFRPLEAPERARLADSRRASQPCRA